MWQKQHSIRFMQISMYITIVIGFVTIDRLHSSFGVAGQKTVEYGQKPIGAFRVFPKTTFSCLGRPAGYYADIGTGCQIYHMCDGLGRQFSYSCPNTTLFQQRMLICDHWYMVNCSKAESDYAANLLIGQRDKPFVPEEENQLRTPRPDLLDRPYAPDYSGESFRNQYKDHRQISNEISDSDGTEKQYFNEVNPPSATRWHLPRKQNQNARSPNPNLIRRNDIIEENNSSDLGTSYSSNYNSSSDFSAETSSSLPTRSTTFRTFPTTTTTLRTTTRAVTNSPITTTTQYIKPPSRLYEPPFLYPIYNLNYTAENEDQESSTISTTLPTTTTTSTTRISTTTFLPTTIASTTETLSIRPAIFSGRPFTHNFGTTSSTVPSTFSVSTAASTTTENYENFISKSQFVQSTSKPKSFVTQTQTTFKQSITSERPSEIPTPFLDLLPPAVDRLSAPEPFKSKTDRSSNTLLPTPSNLLLPPFQEFVQHDVATTQGPPIYFEWKIPSNALEPPKLDPPPGVEDDNQQSKDDIITAGSTAIAENYTTSSPFSHNPFLAPIVNNHDNQHSKQNSIRTPTVRSIPKIVTTSDPKNSSNQRNNDYDDNTTSKNHENLATAEASHPREINIQQIQKDYLIPDFHSLQLENDARTGYDQSDGVNSFQLKIPERRNDNKPWYGENPKCPECHPSFVKPGTCEPCVRR